jgi:hypothetical protein
MKKIIAILVFSLLGFSNLSFAQSLTANVSSKQVSKNQGFNLTLELEGAEPAEKPDFSALNGSFKILGQEQSSFTKIINGESSSSLVWTLHLLPIRSGSVEIPSFAIHTHQGELSSEPLVLNVDEGTASGGAPVNQTAGMSLKGFVSERSIYQDQPVIVTYQLRASRNMSQAQIGELSAKDAIIEKVGEPTVKTEISHGQVVQVLNATYRVTSLKSGTLNLPPLVIQGMASAPQKNSPRSRNPFPSLGDDDDVFASMRAMMANFNQSDDLFNQFTNSEPVTVSSAPMSLQVLPPVAGIQPWLPAENIQLSEAINDTKFKAGESFELSIITKALGVDPSQLPSVEEQLRGADFKVYADQPEISASREKLQLESTKIEKFTLIPQKSGDLKIPEIKMLWWNTSKGIAQTTLIPERLIHVLPGSILTQSNPAQEPKSETHALPLQNQNRPWLSLSMLICGGILIGYSFRKRLFFKNPSQATKEAPIEDSIQKVGKKDLLACENLQAIKEFIQQYGTSSLTLPSGLSISRTIEIASAGLSGSELARARKMIKAIDSALYFNVVLDLAMIKQELQWLFFDRKKIKSQSTLHYPSEFLNPT